MSAPQDIDEMLDAVVRSARASVPGFDEVSISVRHADGRYETAAGTGELVVRLDEVQYQLDSGPCIDAMKRHDVVVAARLADDRRWPEYVRAATSAGVRSQMGIHLCADEHFLGSLNFYSTLFDTVDPEAELAAQVLATCAANTLGHVRRERQLTEAIESRTVIGQATGLLMERYKIDAVRAFQYLVRASSTSNTKLRDVARKLVESAEVTYSRPRR